MVLAMTHEEVVADLTRDLVHSYRQLPAIVYHFQTKFRDEPRARGGLIRVREFVMKDSYSIDADAAGLDRSYDLHHQAYTRIFERLGLRAIPVSSDVGIMGGTGAHEFMVINPHGEDTLVLCDACGFAANQQVAPNAVPSPSPDGEEMLAAEEIATPGTDTIASLAELLGVPTSRTAKAAFFMTGDGRLVTAIVRGDFEVNETKLANAVKAVRGIRPAQAEEIRAAGMEPGYGSPVGAHDTLVVVDALAAASPNLVAGANRPGFHLRNVNVGRDFTAEIVIDIANARDGDPCPNCGGAVHLAQGIEVGNIFKLGSDFTEALGAEFVAEDGSRRHPIMGSYGIGLGRAMACIVEAHHDERGIAWPAEVAPYRVHLLSIGASRDPAVAQSAEALYERLVDAGV
jgi:prolyl-tRNA synthetase